jgi:Fe-S-cluster-containing hydrogenase component 2
MAEKQGYQKRTIWQIILGSKPEKASQQEPGEQLKKAVKCDMCKDILGGPVCVRACPTGAALRMNPEDFLGYVK